MDDAASDPPDAPPGAAADALRVVLWGLVVGIPASLGAALLLAAVHELEDLLWDDLPDALGHASAPWYLIVALPIVGAAVVVVARRFLPGDGGHRPLLGLAGPSPAPSHVFGIVLAAVGTLSFGAVLGPEGPLIALGSIVGTVVATRARLEPMGAAVLAGAGSFAAVSALFGGPIVAGILMLEAGVGLGAAAIPALLPGFVAAAVGYVLFVGLDGWGGLDTPGLAVPDLPTYEGTRIVDLVLAVVVGVVVMGAVAIVRRLAIRVEGLAPKLGMAPLLLAGGLTIGLLALAADGLGASPNDILFSGQNSMGTLVTEGSTAALAVVLAAKTLAYVVSLGAGFRGGPIFPAVFLGVGVASFATLWFDSSPTWAVAVGAAAGTAAQTRLVLASIVLGSLLVAGSGVADTTPAAVLAAVAAWLTGAALDRRASSHASADPPGMSG